MAKSKKCDFRKLALLGITGGTMIASTEGVANSTQHSSDLNNYSQLLAFNGCGGAQGCHSQGTGGNKDNYQAYRNTASQNYSYGSCQTNPTPQYYNQVQSSCQSASAQYYQTSSCHAATAPQYYQQTSGGQSNTNPSYGNTNSSSQQTPTPQYYQAPSSCQTYTNPSYSRANQSSGCGSFSANTKNTTPSPIPPKDETEKRFSAYSQWETNHQTADTGKYGTTTKPNQMSESELRSQLNEQGKSAFDSLDSTGKSLVIKMATQDCKGQNECKGLNSCKTEEHACAGKGSCAGTAKSNFKDKNLAVKVAALKMAEKRVNAAPSKY